MLGITGFIIIHEFNRLNKRSFHSKMKEVVKGLASKSRVDNSVDIAYKNAEKNKTASDVC